MAKRDRSTTQAVIAQRIKEGRGKGHGKDYKPWLNIQDVASDGQVNRKTSWTTGREHQLMSELELKWLFAFDWCIPVIDIREQYPLLPLNDTLAIAEELRIKHPHDPSTGEPIVVTTDFVLTVLEGNTDVQQAVAVKYVAELQDPRVIEKLEIERIYWRTIRVPWLIATERNLDKNFIENIRFLHDYRQLPKEAFDDHEFEDIVTELTQRMHQSIALAKLAADCDKTLGLTRGISLSIAYHLIAIRRWHIDMYSLINPRKPLALLPMAEMKSSDKKNP